MRPLVILSAACLAVAVTVVQTTALRADPVPAVARDSGDHLQLPDHAGPAAPQLDAALVDVARRYGPAAARLARLGLEYDGPGPGGS